MYMYFGDLSYFQTQMSLITKKNWLLYLSSFKTGFSPF